MYMCGSGTAAQITVRSVSDTSARTVWDSYALNAEVWLTSRPSRHSVRCLKAALSTASGMAARPPSRRLSSWRCALHALSSTTWSASSQRKNRTATASDDVNPNGERRALGCKGRMVTCTNARLDAHGCIPRCGGDRATTSSLRQTIALSAVALDPGMYIRECTTPLHSLV